MRYLSWMIIGTLLTLFGGMTAAQDRVYINIPGIQGESSDAAHLGWIDAYGLSSDAFHPGDPVTGGGQVGLLSLDPIFVLKGTDLSSPALHGLLTEGDFTNQMTIEVCREPAGGGQECYYTIVLNNVLVNEIRLSGSSCVDPLTSCVPTQTESVGLAFAQIKQTYRSYVGGSVNQTSCSCWDRVNNVECNASCP